MINVLNFEAGNLKLDKKTWMNLDIYYIDYVNKKPDWNVNSVNPLYLYLMINRFYGHIEKQSSVKYLIISDINKNSDVLKNIIRCFLVLNITATRLITIMVNMKKIT